MKLYVMVESIAAVSVHNTRWVSMVFVDKQTVGYSQFEPNTSWS